MDRKYKYNKKLNSNSLESGIQKYRKRKKEKKKKSELNNQINLLSSNTKTTSSFL